MYTYTVRSSAEMDYDYWDGRDDECEEVLEAKYQIQQKTLQRQNSALRMPLMLASTATPSYNIRDARPLQSTSVSPGGDVTCAVCGDGQAKLHYGVLACYGCKGFFRRTLTGKYRYVCRFGNNCVVDKFQRNSCRYCRFNRCLEVGMDPKAVRPDRDLTGKQKVPRIRKKHIDEELLNHMMRLQGDDWTRKLQVDVRVLLMQLMNIESKVVKGELNMTQPNRDPLNIPPPRDSKSISLREMFESKPQMESRRMEIRYEPLRQARVEELPAIAHRRAIAAVDWVDCISEIAEISETEDKVALVKNCYAPLTIFNFSARTAQNTKNPDILCLCSHSFVPRRLPPEFNEQNQLSNNLIDRTLNELVGPLRKMNLKEEEIVPLKAILVLNPNTKGLSENARAAITELRDKVQDVLFQIVKELHPSYNASSRFGNLLLLLPTIATLSSVMCENMQFCQAFGGRASGDPLLSEMFGDFKLEEPPQISSSSGSPPLFENPADISLGSISPPSLSGESIHTIHSPVRAWFQKRVDVSTQTETGPPPNPAHSLISGGYGSPLAGLPSPFSSLLDEDIVDSTFSPGDDFEMLTDTHQFDDLMQYIK
ncbi:unnamed protein product, partial [Mesorhabditis belari]|uniref:Uncharacterized protein n=1 Tax=Mesorhabditis belari TaxID=2138241 RepID=A0AAF3EYT3_9BILA